MTPAVAAAVIRANGFRAIKDEDLAGLLGISLPELYKRIGDKLWCFSPTFYCKLANQYNRGRQDTQPRLAFFHGGVIALAGTIGDGASFQMGLHVAYALKSDRRKSRWKLRGARRVDDAVRSERYYQAKASLHDLLEPFLRSRSG